MYVPVYRWVGTCIFLSSALFIIVLKRTRRKLIKRKKEVIWTMASLFPVKSFASSFRNKLLAHLSFLLSFSTTKLATVITRPSTLLPSCVCLQKYFQGFYFPSKQNELIVCTQRGKIKKTCTQRADDLTFVLPYNGVTLNDY